MPHDTVKASKKKKTKPKASAGKENIMADPTLADFQALLKQADDETNRIAQRITDLMNAVQPGLSAADAQTIKDGLQAEVTKLQGVGTVPTPGP
jgi:hypothetical protein